MIPPLGNAVLIASRASTGGGLDIRSWLPSVIVGSLALIFAVASFWVIQVRRGRLVGHVPQVFAGAFNPTTFRFRLPLTIYNSGARSLVVTDIRLIFVDDDMTVPVIAYRGAMKPGAEHDSLDFAHPFAIPGRQAVSKFVEFGGDGWAPELETEHRVRVEVRTDRDWVELVSFDLTTPTAETGRAYITHRRDPSDNVPRTLTFDPNRLS
jgi:hypothetical protein